MYIFPMY